MSSLLERALATTPRQGRFVADASMSCAARWRPWVPARRSRCPGMTWRCGTQTGAELLTGHAGPSRW